MSCPQKFWCHVGGTQDSFYCCPKSRKVKELCHLAPANGFGYANIARFWYDWRSSSCKQLTYAGFGGNENNFLTKLECEKQCFGNVSFIHNLLFSQYIKIKFNPISPTNRSGGNANNFESDRLCLDACGIGNSKDSNICSLIVAHGSGPYKIPRFYYDAQNNACKQFVYSGIAGNDNPMLRNMHKLRSKVLSDKLKVDLSKDGVIIRNSTETVLDPCLQVLPNDFHIQYCSPSDSLLCPRGTFCQIGAGIQNTFCCPIINENPCLQPVKPGIGNVRLSRWYYDAYDNHCTTFFFNGFKGNQNNFLTFRACQQSCGAINPCKNGEPQIPTDAQTQCSPDNIQSCPLGTYCQILEDVTKSICCPGSDQTIPNTSVSPVSLVEFGNSGFGNTYGMNIAGNNGSIQNQIFGANNANVAINNNIKSLGYPESVAIPNGQVSSRAMSRYNGNNLRTRIYTGQIGSQANSALAFPNLNGMNNFANSFSRLPSGTVLSNTAISPTFLLNVTENPIAMIISTDSSTPKNRCLLPLATGTGSFALPRYYFDTEASLCRSFTFAGFNGNDNNFETIQECRTTCPEYDNPCLFGIPYINENDGSVAFCTASYPLCPTNYWCHVGDRRQTSSVIIANYCSKNILLITENFNAASSSFAFLTKPMANFQRINMMQKFDAPAQDANIDHDNEYNDALSSTSVKCFQPLLQGRGQAKLLRYYFNGRTRTCDQFIYSGKGGNQNNFLSKSDCEEACPIIENPCENGFPAIGPEGIALQCGDKTATICGAGYYCHIGATSSTTVCCPTIGDPCRMPLSAGSGNMVLNRWYFNMQSQICVTFVYTGRGGNANNFQTHKECSQACPEFRNPCSTGQPHIGLNGQITHCGATGPSICPTTYWCHIGATLENSVCCPGSGIPCEKELEIGDGYSTLVRFYYDSETRTCQQFQYSGFGGNENNFLTLRDCEARCPVLPNPCGLGQPQLDEQQNPVGCSAAATNVCDADYFCHIGDTEQTTVCCPGKSKNVCNEPRVPGTGRAHLSRYAFAPLTRQCLPFIYTGLGGNENNFLSRASCEAACSVVSNPCAMGEPAAGNDGQYLICSASGPNICPIGYWCHVGADIAASLCCPGAQNPCTLSLMEGSGSLAIPRWYYDRRLRQCVTFTYTGYGGNQNNFQTIQECQEKCPEQENPCSTGDPAESSDGNILQCSELHSVCPQSYFCNIGATPETSVCCPSFGEPCLAPLCHQFLYTGLGGNENNFLTIEACERKCPILRNPCPLNDIGVVTSSFVTLIKCNARNAYSCPLNFWCHIGGDSETTVCCPGASNPCQLPLSQGIITENGPYTRWFYDKISGSCKPFQYAGIGGNQNNFLTRSQCTKQCPESPPTAVRASVSHQNICPIGLPIQSQDGTNLICSLTNPCPSNYFCHFGADLSTTVCCQITTLMSPCSLPVQIGHGFEHIRRVYYNAALQQCVPFIYSGLGGNENSFLTFEECAAKCLGQEKLRSRLEIQRE
ncbi:unnamed protein product [Thelazia callipaeda]|uniref:Kunitz/Bovine pancreatic trypsin inhibitor domain protein n=1 Tax=Thelazia callipaeda TaxID=103827 RepID=A0A0N5DA40_THECL|nr:unnamed protein product [Thelazia callipaeda]